MSTLGKGWQEAPLTVQKRPDLKKAYKAHMLSYLSKIYPQESTDTLSDYIDEIIKDRYKNPVCELVVYPKHGSIDMIKTRLMNFVTHHQADVLTPAGTAFKADLDHVPPSVEYNKQCTASRSYYKKLMFKCMEKGDSFGVDLNDKKQALRKIKNNSIIGGRGFEGNPLYDRESFGAITSLGRNNVILTYTLTEQCFSNNFYWPTGEKIYDYIIFVSEHTPDSAVIADALACCPTLYIPTPEVITERLTESAKYYIEYAELKRVRAKVLTLVSQLSQDQRIYLFYRRNLLNLFTYNDAYMRTFLSSLMHLDENVLSEATPEDALTLPSDVSMMLSIIYDRLLQGKAVNKDFVKEHPDIATRFAQIGKACLSLLDSIDPLMQVFMYTGELVSELLDNKNILRRTVAGSDTDSILFTMKDPVMWYLKAKTLADYKITEEGIHFSAYLVYILSKILNIANRDLIIAKGAVGANADEISLKSEFFYAVFIKTDMGKHYVSAYLSKEGRIQKEPKLDIKGVEFQSSTLPQASRDMAEGLIKSTISTIYHTGKISALELIYTVMAYEKKILEMINAGSLYYYTNVSIKSHKSEYKKPEISIWFNYELWEEIFAPLLGHLVLPGKFPLIPFKKKMFRSPFYLRYVQEKDPATADRLKKALSRIPASKNISRLPIPGDLTTIPEILLPLIDVRSIIAKNVKPAQLFLRQFGIHPGDPRKLPLFIDHYHSVDDQILLRTLSSEH